MSTFVPLLFARLVKRNSIGITSSLALDVLQAQPSQVDFFVNSLYMRRAIVIHAQVTTA